MGSGRTEKSSMKAREAEAERPVNKYHQIGASFFSALTIAAGGHSFSKSSFLLPQLEDAASSSFVLSKDESSWYASVLMLGCLPGALCAGIISERYGRRTSLLVDNVIFVAGCLLEAFTPDSLYILLLGRLLCGHAMISSLCCSPMYICEISQPCLRGVTSSLNVIGLTCGFGSVLLLGASLPWRLAILLTSLTSVVSFVGLYFSPETPVWLLRQERVSEALEALEFLRGDEQIVMDEMERIQANLIVQDKEDSKKPSAWETARTAFSDPNFVKPFTLVFVLISFGLDCSVCPALAFYMVKIFKESGLPLDPYWTSALVACWRAALTIPASGIVHRYRRRPLLLTTGCIMVLSASNLALHSFMRTRGMLPDLELVKWIPLLCVGLTYTGFAMGYGSTLFSLQGELLPAEYRSFGSSVIMLLDNLLLFGSSKLIPIVQDNLGLHGLFGILAGVQATALLFLYFSLPETYGLSLEQIEGNFRRDTLRKREKKLQRQQSRQQAKTTSPA